MTEQSNSQPVAEFVDRNLLGARFIRSDLSNIVMRGVVLEGAQLDGETGDELVVNGVNVVPFIETELNQRFPGRALRHTETVDGLVEAWSAVERAWSAAMERSRNMTADAVDVSVDGEWSFA